MSARSAVSGTSQIPRETAALRRCVWAAPAATSSLRTRTRSPVDGPRCRAAPRPSPSPCLCPTPLDASAAQRRSRGFAVLPPVDSTMRQWWEPCAQSIARMEIRRTSLLSGSTSLPPAEPSRSRAFANFKTNCSQREGAGWMSSSPSSRDPFVSLSLFRVTGNHYASYPGAPQVTHLPIKRLSWLNPNMATCNRHTVCHLFRTYGTSVAVPMVSSRVNHLCALCTNTRLYIEIKEGIVKDWLSPPVSTPALLKTASAQLYCRAHCSNKTVIISFSYCPTPF